MKRIRYLLQRLFSMNFSSMFKTINKIHTITHKNRLMILFDMIYCGLVFQAGYMDYLVFEMYLVPNEIRKTYITRGISNSYVKLLNPKAKWHQLDDKVDFLKQFDRFIGRDWLDLREASFSDFESFCHSKDKIVAKSIAGTGGWQVFIHEIDDQSDLKALYESFIENGLDLVEEFIVQHELISSIYPHSVNTLRIVTIRNGDKVHVVYTALRIGNGKFVDNLSSGGFAALVDRETGIIIKPGANRNHDVVWKHPYTQTTLVGVQLPFYPKVIEMVSEAAKLLESLRYVGWDVAFTEKGPILIEANSFPGHDIYQLQAHLNEDRVGLKPLFDDVIAGKYDTV